MLVVSTIWIGGSMRRLAEGAVVVFVLAVCPVTLVVACTAYALTANGPHPHPALQIIGVLAAFASIVEMLVLNNVEFAPSRV